MTTKQVVLVIGASSGTADLLEPTVVAA